MLWMLWPLKAACKSNRDEAKAIYLPHTYKIAVALHLCCIGSRATAGAGVPLLDAPLGDYHPLGFKCRIVINAPSVEARQN